MHRPQEKRISEISLWMAHQSTYFYFFTPTFHNLEKLSSAGKAKEVKYSQFFTQTKFRGCTIWANTRPLSVSGFAMLGIDPYTRNTLGLAVAY